MDERTMNDEEQLKIGWLAVCGRERELEIHRYMPTHGLRTWIKG